MLLYVYDFVLSANICFNLTHIIKNNIKLEWNLNVFHSFIELIEELLNNSLSYNQLKILILIFKYSFIKIDFKSYNIY